eukprot:jgi/Psemu1/179175/e_gw1.8.24.1
MSLSIRALLVSLQCSTKALTTTAIPKARQIAFEKFQFSPNNVCIYPQYFVTREEESGKDTCTYFTMRNVPGDGDCMFLAVALAAASSMGLGGSDDFLELLRATSRETREMVAQVLASDGKLYIGVGNNVDASLLLESAMKLEPSMNTTEDYLAALRKEGRNGGLYGGGPELAVLSNILRRPISIYEADYDRLIQQASTGKLSFNDTETSSEGVFPIVCKGSFGEGVFEDPCLTSIPDSVIGANMPGEYSWRLHILVLDVSPTQKHACVLLPRQICD